MTDHLTSTGDPRGIAVMLNGVAAADIAGLFFIQIAARRQTNPANNAKAGVLRAEIARKGVEIKYRNGE